MQVICPRCRRQYSVSPQIAGTKVQCTSADCQHIFEVAPVTGGGAESVAKPPPPLPPAPGKKVSVPVEHRGRTEKKEAVVPKASPVATMGTMATVDRVLDALTKAVSLQKIGFFFLSTFLSILTVCLLAGLIVVVAAQAESVFVLVLLIIPILIAIGLVGVISGGVARLMHLERQSGVARWKDALDFCRRRFVSLFLSALAALFAILLSVVIVNGVIAAVAMSGAAGSWIAAILFVPQVFVNLVLAVALPAGVIVPCAIAVEQTTAGRAIRQYTRCLFHHARSVLLHFAVTASFGVLLLAAVAPLLAMAFGYTMSTNGPSVESSLGSSADFLSRAIDSESADGMFGTKPGAANEEFWTQIGDEPEKSTSLLGDGLGGIPGSRRTGGGDVLRGIGILIVMLIPAAYFIVYWICSFTRYYESLLPELSPAQRSQSPS